MWNVGPAKPQIMQPVTAHILNQFEDMHVDYHVLDN